MAEKLQKVKVTAGRLVPVRNLGKKIAARASYFACWVEDANGRNERCLLFTPAQLRVAEERARKNREDLPKKDRLFDVID